MTKQVQRRRGTDTQHTSFTGAEGELSVNTTNKSVHVHDGATAGGIEAARADLGNVSDADLNSALTGNTLSSLTITSADINGGTIDGTVIGGTTPAAGNFTNISATGTIDGRDVAADGTKLDGIEAGADVTDTANVTAAGALMDSELTDITAVKALDQGVATTDDPTFTNTQLAAIAESKGVTAVDVFVYDTSKDSDGGAWRKRTQGTSWYNETLNTTTRGSRREFPAVAVIVAETGKVTIYDGDDPALPMWMVFNRGGSYPSAVILGRSVPNNTSVASLNGVLAVGIGTSGYGEALSVINFVSDSAVMHTSASSWRNGQDISGRNTPTTLTVDSSVGNIISLIVNDVAMTVLPDAPIDPATGLPVPTIAVATAGGVSVIKDDGNVWDITGTNWGGSSTAVSFDGGTLYFIQSILYWLACEVAGLSQDHALFDGYNSLNDNYPFKRVTLTESIAYRDAKRKVATGGETFDLAHHASHAYPYDRLVQHKRGVAGGPNLFNYTTSTYNTGWMNGDIKGAFLSDTDDTDLVGSGELVTNGTFDTDLSGWTDSSTGTGSISWNASGYLELNSTDSDNRGIASQSFSTVVGEAYVITSSQVGGLSGLFRVGTSVGGSQNLSQSQVTGDYVNTFVATATTTYVTIYGNPSGTTSYDNISVKLADPDRSVNNKGLIVNGTVTRSPVATGAELVAYSGFSASNYLEQPYNSDLDFGTGDFCVMGWTKSADYGGIIHRSQDKSAVNSGGTSFSIYRGSPTGISAYLKGGTNLSGVTVANSWMHFCLIRKSGFAYLYMNGVLSSSSASAGNLTVADAETLVGGWYSSGSVAGFSSNLALLRISATAPTAEQIAKIYNDEKVLFQENAQATLYGSSDAVTALAHDDATDLLHVGTSAGRSVFQGLRRVSNTTTAVGTAISASNGLVVEE